MSESVGPQPPPVVKPKAALSSNFIEKGSRKFAPRAVGRRRPGAKAAVAAAVVAPTASQPAVTPQAEAQTQPEHTPPPPPEQPETVQLSTPAATQEVLRNDSAATGHNEATLQAATPPEETPTPQDDPTTTGAEEPVQPSAEPTQPTPVTTPAPTPTPEVILEAPQPTAVESSAPVAPTDSPAEATAQTVSPPTAALLDLPAEETAATSQEDAVGNAAAQTSPAPGRPRRGTMSWATVNAPQEDDIEPDTNLPKRRTPDRRRRGGVTLRNIDEEEAEEGEEQEEDIAQRRPSAKARGKRSAGEIAEGDEAEAARPAKIPRKPRRKKAVEGEGANEEGGAAPPRPKRKRKTKSKSAEHTEGDGAGGEQQPKRKGRPPREDTPSDAEDGVIDEAEMTMHNIASRNIRVGRLSERERKMREVDWDKIKRERAEAEALHADHRKRLEEERRRKAEEQAQVEASRAVQQENQMVMGENGQFVITEAARTIDQEAVAQRERDAMETLSENDVTKRVTYKTNLRNSKRNPQEFMLPGQGKRWTVDATNKFYQALTTFGTDFMMISTLFPGSTRRSIKLKFVREERSDPDRIKAHLLLLAKDRVAPDWDAYLQESGRQGETFRDPQVIKWELEEQKREFDEKIAEARKAAEEEKRQRRIAGIESDNEGDKDKENGKGKKKKRERTVAFVEEEGVEVLGGIDEDDSWGRE